MTNQKVQNIQHTTEEGNHYTYFTLFTLDNDQNFCWGSTQKIEGHLKTEKEILKKHKAQ